MYYSYLRNSNKSVKYVSAILYSSHIVVDFRCVTTLGITYANYKMGKNAHIP